MPLSVCKTLVSDYGCDPKSADANGDTLLHYALNLENEELEEWLVDEVGISKDVTNKEGLTPYADE